jgi:DNA invertase Pin-like site-specific DNA recombinase
MKKAAIYHFTDSTKRVKIYQKQLNTLEKYAKSLGFSDIEFFCDLSLLRKERHEFDRFLTRANTFDALIVKDFYHISKNTTQCVKIMTSLRNSGIEIYTIDNGSFCLQKEPVDKHLQVATYCSRFGTISGQKQLMTLQNDILKLFANKKTKWTVQDQYYDESKHQKDGEQQNLKHLITNKDSYDLLLVHNMNDIHWRTANFCKVREKLQLDIYSLEEGFLKYTRKETTT